MKSKIHIIDVNTDNVSEKGIYCIKNKKAPGFKKKIEWFKNKFNNGLRIKIATDESGKQLGFIEYIPSEFAWRPINAENYFFIQCIAIFSKDAKRNNIGSSLLQICEDEAKHCKKLGVCTMSSNGAWMASKTIFEKNGYTIVDQLGRFELMCKTFDGHSQSPRFNDWTIIQKKYKGWNLIYSNQCPWHEKSITDLKQSALDKGINLKIERLDTPREAQNAPSGFGTFSLIYDGKLIEDHYLSRTRFENILKQELKNSNKKESE